MTMRSPCGRQGSPHEPPPGPRPVVALRGSMTRRRMTLLLALFAAAGCERGADDSRWFGAGEERVVSSSAGDAELDANGRLNFEVTSDLYGRWTVAQRALSASPIARAIAQLGRRALTQRELDAAVRRVESDAAASAAIQNAGLSALEYVYATVALEQAMAVAKGRLAPLRSGVPSRNVELARQNQDELLRGGVTGDSTLLVQPPPTREAYEALPPAAPPQAAPPSARDTAAPAPTPRDTVRPTPAPTPQPQPTPRPTPTPPSPPPVDTTGLHANAVPEHPAGQ